MLFWVEKGLAKLTIYKHVRPLLRRINSAPVISSQKPLVQEVVLPAELRCPSCQKRVTDAISSIEGKYVESIVVHVVEKKVTLTPKSTAEGSSTRVPVVFNNLACKTLRNPDANQPRNTNKDPLHVPNGLMTRSKTKTLKDALNALVLKVSTKSKLEGPLKYQEEILVYLIHVQEGSNTTLFES
ncbi:hypothetical protein NC653_034704 [Populus alba x Populus x berolinensis]|uniref:HMA domain-containing protein n=1 Tax=Populus alba x Populus x berolinensis TaxID=444605 RepID=A0AAD6LN54_9ROSI|nr:hypothetical protein NC653_034704 [Populus alba x Populus x berolinensis]